MWRRSRDGRRQLKCLGGLLYRILCTSNLHVDIQMPLRADEGYQATTEDFCSHGTVRRAASIPIVGYDCKRVYRRHQAGHGRRYEPAYGKAH
ncbi:MAG: hypothetical protein ACLTW9_30795 [Enterocloster sp.]